MLDGFNLFGAVAASRQLSVERLNFAKGKELSSGALEQRCVGFTSLVLCSGYGLPPLVLDGLHLVSGVITLLDCHVEFIQSAKIAKLVSRAAEQRLGRASGPQPIQIMFLEVEHGIGWSV